MHLFAGALRISCSERKLAKSALFDDRAINPFQFTGRGTFLPSMIHLIGWAVLERCFLVEDLIDRSRYLSNKTSIRSHAMPFLVTASTNTSARSPNVFALSLDVDGNLKEASLPK
jgi:hypothetical protein